MPSSTKQTGSQTDYTTAPGMNQILGNAQYIFNSGKAWRPNTTSQVTPFSTQTRTALGGITNASSAAAPAAQQSFSQLSATLNDGGLNDLQDQQAGRLQQYAGGNGFNGVQQQGADWLKGIAGGSDLNGNPQLEDVIRRGSQDIANSDNLMASLGGRYGSGSHEGVLQKNLADFSGNLRFTDYNNQQARRDSAIRDYFGMGTTGQGQQSEAINSLYNIGGQQRQNQIDAPGQLAAGFNSSLAPWQALGKVGQAYEQKNQQIIDDKARVFNEGKNSLTDPVNWLQNLASAYKSGGQVTNKQYNPLAQAIGGGIAGYDVFGGPIGAGAGALQGLFG